MFAGSAQVFIESENNFVHFCITMEKQFLLALGMIITLAVVGFNHTVSG